MASSMCVTTTCPAGTNAFVTTLCTKLCVPASRNVTAAALSNDGRTITLALTAAAQPASFVCSELFDAATMALLGAASWCVAADTTVTVKLLPGSTIGTAGVLSIKANQTVLRDLLVPTVTFTSPANVTITPCGACVAPVTTVLAPTVRPLLGTCCCGLCARAARLVRGTRLPRLRSAALHPVPAAHLQARQC